MTDHNHESAESQPADRPKRVRFFIDPSKSDQEIYEEIMAIVVDQDVELGDEEEGPRSPGRSVLGH